MKSINDYSDKIKQAKELIAESDAIIIGIGSGLSAAGGLDYGNPELVHKWYPEYYNLGCRSLFDIMGQYWVTAITEENATKYWGFWAKHILNIRYITEATQPYKDLSTLFENKNYFIITTNADGQTQKVFPKDKIFAPQGNYAYLQCQKPCCDEVYYNEDMVRTMIDNMPNAFEIRGCDIPKCPRCGSFLIPNLRADNSFVEAPNLLNMEEYQQFILENSSNKLVFMELGVGFNTPVIIRYPFESMTNEFVNTHLIRINKTQSEVPKEIAHKSISICECLSKVTNDLL